MTVSLSMSIAELSAEARKLDHTSTDNERTAVLSRMWDLERSVVISRSSARDDLNSAGYYHVQPCGCGKCRV